MKIGIITGNKLADAWICEAISQSFPNPTIVHYSVPFNKWITWILKRIRRMGLLVLIGHLLLSAYLRLLRTLEFFKGKSIWQVYANYVPSWNNISYSESVYLTETALISKVQSADLIILTDSFRLSYEFFRQVKSPVIQLVWGKVPEYMGDSGGFWAFALSQRSSVEVTIIQRYSSLDRIRILANKKVATSNSDNLRTIKVKQTKTLVELLPNTLQAFIEQPQRIKEEETQQQIRVFQAPTLFTYLRFLKKHKVESLPRYSHTLINSSIITQK